MGLVAGGAEQSGELAGLGIDRVALQRAPARGLAHRAQFRGRTREHILQRGGELLDVARRHEPAVLPRPHQLGDAGDVEDSPRNPSVILQIDFRGAPSSATRYSEGYGR
jgi:hypothetical protein